MQDIEVVGVVLALAKAVCGSLHTGRGIADGARVILAVLFVAGGGTAATTLHVPTTPDFSSTAGNTAFDLGSGMSS